MFDLTNQEISESYHQLAIAELTSVTDGTGSTFTCLEINKPSASVLFSNKLYTHEFVGCVDSRKMLEFHTESIVLLGTQSFTPNFDNLEGSSVGLIVSGGLYYLGNGTIEGSSGSLLTTSSITFYPAAEATCIDNFTSLRNFCKYYQVIDNPPHRENETSSLEISYSLFVKGCRNFSDLSSLTSTTSSISVFTGSCSDPYYTDVFQYDLKNLDPDGIVLGQPFITGSSGSFCINYSCGSINVISASVTGQKSAFLSEGETCFYIAGIRSFSSNVIPTLLNHTASVSGSYNASVTRFVKFIISPFEMTPFVTGSNLPITQHGSSLCVRTTAVQAFDGIVYEFQNINGATTNTCTSLQLGFGQNCNNINFSKVENPNRVAGSKPENIDVNS